jgi:predicted dithiol-disulfide oxidoreductase (DUF899 family)
MTKHIAGTREEWLAARLALLEAEKELTRRSDELAWRRQELPWVRVDKEYRFETDEGSASLADLFSGRSQLLVYHFIGVLYHTYSTYARGLGGLWGMYQWLDRAPKGRNETSSACARRGLYAWVRRLPFCNFLQYLMSDPLY